MIAEDVEPRARELGVWTLSAHRRDGLCMRGEPSGFQVCEGGDKFKRWIDLTAPEAALFLRCVASGLAVELPCSDCDGSKVETMTRAEAQDAIRRGDYKNFGAVWRAGWNYSAESGEAGGWPLLARPCPTCSEPGPACVACAWKKGPMLFDRRQDAREWCKRNGYALRIVARMPGGVWGLWSIAEERWYHWGDLTEVGLCPACKGEVPGPGVPTGRETVGLAAAWMRGRPTPCERRFSTIGYALAFARDIAEEDFTYRRGSLVRWTEPGDPSTREALGVLADKRQSEGDPLGELLALDLAGADCPACEPGPGFGRVPWGSARDGEWCGWPCRVCEGHGTALAQRQRAIGTAAHPAASLTTAASA